MTQIGHIGYDPSPSFQRCDVSLWRLTSPATGSHAVAVTARGASTAPVWITVGAISFSGADQTTPVGTAVTNKFDSGSGAASISQTLSSTTSGNLIVDAVGCGSGGEVSASGTLRWLLDTNTLSAGGNGASSTKASPGGSTTMGYTISTDFVGFVAVEINAATGGTSTRPATPVTAALQSTLTRSATPVTVAAQLPGQHGYPIADGTRGNWTTQAGGTTSLYATVDEVVADDTDYVQSGLAPSSDALTLDLTQLSLPVAGNRTLSYRYSKDAGTERIDLVVDLLQGTTVVQTWTHTDIATTWTQQDQNITGTITDYTTLHVRLTATQV
jgi:hypothetical protein